MKIDSALLDNLSSQANFPHGFGRPMTCARLPRTTPKGFSTDGSASGEPSLLELSRVVTEEDEVNAMEPGTVLPIHWHRGSTETVVVLRGKVRQNFYDENGQLAESIEVSAGSSSTPSINSGTGSPQVVGFSVELGRWHNTECLESGTVILECKDGRYEALAPEDVMEIQERTEYDV